MRGGTRWGRRLAVCGLVVGWLVADPARAMADGGRDLPTDLRREGIHWPGEGGRRIAVSIGLYVVDFARINLREESFDMAGYLDTSWTDPTLALGPGEASGKVRRFRAGQIWSPALEFVNAVEQVNTEREADLYADDEGRVSQRVRFSHKFQSPLKLRRYPFDTQVLSILVMPFDPFARDLELVTDPGRIGRLEGASVTDWDIASVAARVEGSKEDARGQRFLFEVTVDRRSAPFVWRILLPMTLLVLTSWSVFWVEPTNLQPQLSTGLAILLSLVTFTYSIDSSLPKVAYLTFIDRYTLTSFSSLLLLIVVVVVLHVRVRSAGIESAMKIQRVARAAFPVAFAMAVALSSALSFFFS